MYRDTQFLISNCMICIRHQKVPIWEHPALSLPIGEVMDRVQIDYIFGLPVTENGFKGVATYIESCTKHLTLTAVKTKTGDESAEILFDYISVYGPMKGLLSDQGREFLNETVDKLLKLTGTERMITSPYQPRTNGTTERANQTIMNCLRKHAETNTKDWDKWLKFIQLAYNSRVHSSTGYTPHELMFGRVMNGFERWVDRNEEDSLELMKRAAQIKKQYEVDIPKAKQNVIESQAQNRKTQDKSSNIILDSIEPNTKVFIRVAMIQGKLEPRYRGPYTVVRRTKKGNYILKNNQGIEMKQSYPLNKLKIVPDTVTDHHEFLDIEKILDNRTRRGVKEYLVK